MRDKVDFEAGGFLGDTEQLFPANDFPDGQHRDGADRVRLSEKSNFLSLLAHHTALLPWHDWLQLQPAGLAGLEWSLESRLQSSLDSRLGRCLYE